MKLAELVNALADEIELIEPQLVSLLDELMPLSIEDESFFTTLESYNEYVQRMGEAAEIVGFSGLQALCLQVQDNTLLLASQSDDERVQVFEFLSRWPSLISHYLHQIDDKSTAKGLVDAFLSAPAPFSPEQGQQVLEQLELMANEVTQGAIFHDAENQRPTVAELEDVELTVPEDVDQRLMDGFLQESPEMALTIVSWAQAIHEGQDVDMEALSTVKRMVHTLKGTGATIGLRGLASIGHHYEDILDYLEEHPHHIVGVVKDIILDAAYCMEQMVSYIAGIDEYPEQALFVLQQLLDLANQIDNGELDTATEEFTSSTPTQSFDSQQTADDNSLIIADNESITAHPVNEINTFATNNHIDNLANVIEPAANKQLADADIINQPAEAILTPDKVNPKPNTNNPAGDTTKPISPPSQAAHTNDPKSALRVSVDKVEALFNVSGEMTVHAATMESTIKALAEQAKALLNQNIKLQKRLFELETLVDVQALGKVLGRSEDALLFDNDFDPLELDQYNELYSTTHALTEEAAEVRLFSQQMEQTIANLGSLQNKQQVLSRDLQHLVINTRMAEVGSLESRLQRSVRTTSQATGKQARLVMTGQSTLIDSDVISRLSDPLLHLLRNAVDHGIELPEFRKALGKDPTGTIRLDFSKQGQQVVLICEDDGQGLDLYAIHEKALAQGLISDNQTLSENEVGQLIFMPGFSSRNQVSEISGRGIGLDVVKAWVNSMNGTVSVSQGERGGTRFELRFAASLSTSHSLIVEASNSLFALSSVHIEQALPSLAGRFYYENQKLFYQYNDSQIPAHLLAKLTSMPINEEKPLIDYHAVIAVINNQPVALAVDRLVDSRELLIKSPGRYARHLIGVAGLSILGNGSVVVSLDLPELIQHHAEFNQKLTGYHVKKSLAHKDERAKILIVDDALTVRNALQQLVEDLGYIAYCARDGVEAVNLLQSIEPNLVLTDLEMPNMNGIELSQHIRNRDDMHDTPIIMITSRSQDKHRRLADQVGISMYLTKPYHDTELIDGIRELLV